MTTAERDMDRDRSRRVARQSYHRSYMKEVGKQGLKAQQRRIGEEGRYQSHLADLPKSTKKTATRKRVSVK
jgi:hypothetical protein